MHSCLMRNNVDIFICKLKLAERQTPCPRQAPKDVREYTRGGEEPSDIRCGVWFPGAEEWMLPSQISFMINSNKTLPQCCFIPGSPHDHILSRKGRS